MAIIHQFPRFPEPIGPGRAQRKEHCIGAAQEFPRAPHYFLNGLQQNHRRVGPDAAVQVVALPAAARFHQVLLPIHFFASRGPQQPPQGQGLKHRAEGICQGIHLVGCESGADAIGETGAQGKNPRRARELFCGWGNG